MARKGNGLCKLCSQPHDLKPHEWLWGLRSPRGYIHIQAYTAEEARGKIGVDASCYLLPIRRGLTEEEQREQATRFSVLRR